MSYNHQIEHVSNVNLLLGQQCATCFNYKHVLYYWSFYKFIINLHNPAHNPHEISNLAPQKSTSFLYFIPYHMIRVKYHNITILRNSKPFHLRFHKLRLYPRPLKPPEFIRLLFVTNQNSGKYYECSQEKISWTLMTQILELCV